MVTEIIDKNLRDELIDNLHHPPGKDPSLRSFYGAVVQMVDEGEPLANTLLAVKQHRPGLTDKHLVNLLFRAVQAIEFDNGNLGYKDFQEEGQWIDELTKITTDPRLSKQFRQILLTRSTNTTIYQRYAGPYAVIAHLYDGIGVRVADLGCGGNYGLRGIELQERFQEINDLTPQSYVSTLLSQKINLLEGLAVDKEKPDREENRKWRLACSFYPQELDQLPSIHEFEARIVNAGKVRFIRADLRTCKGLSREDQDVVILSTVLYQLQFHEQNTLLEKARSMLTENGIIIVQDFAARNPKHPDRLDFGESWFKDPFSYRTYITGKKIGDVFLEALRWHSGRCQSVMAGEDFNEVFQESRANSVRETMTQKITS